MNKRSPYRMGWILTIFDLPVATKVEQRAATKFRNFLLEDGFVMVQYSVYARPCVSYEHMEKHTKRIQKFAPTTGFIRIIFFTDKQWELGINIIGNKSDLKNRESNPEMPDQILFW